MNRPLLRIGKTGWSQELCGIKFSRHADFKGNDILTGRRIASLPIPFSSPEEFSAPGDRIL